MFNCSILLTIKKKIYGFKFFLKSSIPHPEVKHREAIEADYQMKDGMLVLDMREPQVGYALKRLSVNYTTDQALDLRSHHFFLNNPRRL